MEIGRHHTEMNVICNAAGGGVPPKGAWIIVTGEPYMMCAKLIHHAGYKGDVSLCVVATRRQRMSIPQSPISRGLQV